jgi:LCP family protein required for cell wall assembly
MKQSKIDLLRILALFTLVGGIVYFNLYFFFPRALPGLLLIGVPNHQENIILLGSDFLYEAESRKFDDNTAGNSDSLIVMSVNPFKKKVSFVSIPRDTYVEIRGYGHQKINAANLIGGPQFTATVIADNFGIKTSGYLAFNLNAIASIVDILGGIKIYVDKDMFYQDKSGGFEINLKEGAQVLNGKQAAGFIRFRAEPLGDVARVQRQQRFLQQLIHQLLHPKAMVRAPWLLPIIKDSFRTNLPATKLLRILNFVRTLKSTDINFQTLPGDFAESSSGASIWQINKPAAETLFKELF